MDADLLRHALSAPGFMPEDEGLALYEAALSAPGDAPLLEIGSYCGRSAVFLGAAARRRGTLLFTVDHHRGSEEQQPGELYFDERLYDPSAGRVDTLPCLRATLSRAGLEDDVVCVVARSERLARVWTLPLSFLFIDGSHSAAAAHADFEGFASHLVPRGYLAIHDVFPDPADGGRPPYEVYLRALDAGFAEVGGRGSLRVLERVDGGLPG